MRYLQSVQEARKVKLDLKDKKILHLLAENSRIPLTKLCKEVALSRDAVNYRIKGYEKDGLIQGYLTLVDISKFGYNNYHIFIKLNNPSADIEKKIIKKLNMLHFVRAVIKFSGEYDLELAIIAKNVTELDDFITKITNDCKGSIEEMDILNITKPIISNTFPKSFSDTEHTKNHNIHEEYKTDSKDINVLKQIGGDASMNLVDIATKLRISADTVNYRIKKMIDSGIIVKFTPRINYASLDYSLYAVLVSINDLDYEKEELVKQFLKNDKNTLWAVKTIGRFNFLIYLLVKNTEELQQTLTNLRSMFPKKINRLQTLIAYEEYKYLYFPKELF